LKTSHSQETQIAIELANANAAPVKQTSFDDELEGHTMDIDEHKEGFTLKQEEVVSPPNIKLQV